MSARVRFSHRLKPFWWIGALFGMVLVLEYLTPPDYVFGYLYIGPILLASTRFSRRTTVLLTALACGLTLLNLWWPNPAQVAASTLASRMIATLALVVTGVLTDRNQRFQQTVAQQQAQLEAQEKLASIREDFASTLTHDLKTPLLGAIATLQAFQQDSFGPVQLAQQQVLTTMIRSHQTTLHMVETLLDVYRNDNEGLKLNLAPVNLSTLVEEVTATLTGLATNRRISISVNYGPSDFRQLLWVQGDALQLQRVVANLLTNAINHSPRGEKVDVQLEPGSTDHTVKIIDHGAGIHRAELPHLFERFYQGQSNRQARGSGLGLYLSRQIVEAHGGTIWAENHQSRGALFAFCLPTFPYLAAQARDHAASVSENFAG